MILNKSLHTSESQLFFIPNRDNNSTHFRGHLYVEVLRIVTVWHSERYIWLLSLIPVAVILGFLDWVIQRNIISYLSWIPFNNIWVYANKGPSVEPLDSLWWCQSPKLQKIRGMEPSSFPANLQESEWKLIVRLCKKSPSQDLMNFPVSQRVSEGGAPLSHAWP